MIGGIVGSKKPTRRWGGARKEGICQSVKEAAYKGGR